MSPHPIPPSGPQPNVPSGGQPAPAAYEAFRSVMPPGATEKQLQMFVNQYVRDMLVYMKQNDDELKKANERLRRVIEGKDN